MVRKEMSWLKISVLVMSALVFLLLLVAGQYRDSRQHQQQGDWPTAEPYLEITPLAGEQLLVGDAVTQWLQGETDIETLYMRYIATGDAHSAKSVKINYAICDLPPYAEVKSQTVELSENEDFENAVVLELPANKRNVTFDFLFTDRVYYYRIIAKLTDGSVIEGSGQFQTADTPRIISIESIRNMRDIGGVKTADGKTLKQGLVYRGTELDGAVQRRLYITEAAAEILTDQLGIRSEVDLRTQSEHMKDMLGPEVKHTYYGGSAYADSLKHHNNENYRKLFSDFAKKENYPLYVHGTYGEDRTGTVCYLLQLLVGVSEEDAYKEWELSILRDGTVDYNKMDAYRKALNDLEGTTMQEKVENLLISYGVTQEEIESIQNILLE